MHTKLKEIVAELHRLYPEYEHRAGLIPLTEGHYAVDTICHKKNRQLVNEFSKGEDVSAALQRHTQGIENLKKQGKL